MTNDERSWGSAAFVFRINKKKARRQLLKHGTENGTESGKAYDTLHTLYMC